MKKAIAVVALLLAGLGAAANAADNKFTASLMPGLTIPVGGKWASNAFSDGTNYGMTKTFATSLAVDYKFKESLALGMEIGNDWHYTNKEYGTGVSGDEARMLHFTPYVKYSFTKTGKITPYAVLGAGLYNYHQNGLALNGVETYSSRTLSYLGFNAGGGAMYDLDESWALGLDLRWHHVFANLDEGAGERAAFNNITPSLKLQYSFGQ